MKWSMLGADHPNAIPRARELGLTLYSVVPVTPNMWLANSGFHSLNTVVHHDYNQIRMHQNTEAGFTKEKKNLCIQQKSKLQIQRRHYGEGRAKEQRLGWRGWAGMCVHVGGCSSGATTREEVKWGTTQTRLFDTDKFCLFRVTGEWEAKIIGPFAGWKVARSYCCWAAAKAKKKNAFGGSWHTYANVSFSQ